MWQARALSASERWSRLAERKVVQAKEFLDTALCRTWSEQVLAAKGEWTHDFGGEQYSLGLAYYAHHETSRTRHYFRGVAAADARVERVLPGMQAGVVDLISAFTGAPASRRPGWCGPGVHVFVPESPVAERGGSIHFDLEGLRGATSVPMLSVVIVLQPALEGGGLRVWSARHSEAIHPTAAEQAEEPETVRYETGDFVAFEGQRLHQIEPFTGERARITITAHAVAEADGWKVWF